MRERSTWNRTEIAKLASGKTAEDPRAMNQDHLKQQPSADKYVIGDPSDFAEDVATPDWKVEYSGGEVKRNEIGQPELRPETFNHAEKTAAQDEEDEETLEKKANICLTLAQRMLPKTASETASAWESRVEDQALAFMHMPNAMLVATSNRLAQQDEEQEQQAKQAQQQQDGQEQQQGKQAQQQQQDDGQQQGKQAQQDQGQGQDQGQQAKQAQQDGQQGQQDGQQDKQAGQIPENFLKKKEDEGDDDKKQASQKKFADQMAMYSQQACAALQNGDMQAAQQAVQQMAQYAQQQQQQAPKMSQQEAEQQVQQMLAQAMQQQGQGQQVQQQPTMADDDMLNQMLQQPVLAAIGGQTPSASAPTMDIQLEGPSMDVGEIHLGSEDEALTALFASHQEVREAAQAEALRTGIPVAAPASGVRTASTRTVGTRPSAGVAHLGGGASAEPSGDGEINKLAGLWQSAPDVRNVFGS